jgi:Ca2+-binding EF-hand superfamily protein
MHEAPAALRDPSDEGEVDSDDVSDLSCEAEASRRYGQEISMTVPLRLARRVSRNSPAVELANAWRATFEHFQDDREIHKDHLAAALQKLGFLEVRDDWVEELALRVTKYSTLDEDEFDRFVQLYEERFSEDFAKLFAEFHEGGGSHMHLQEVSNLLKARGLATMKYAIQEVLEELNTARAGEAWRLEPMAFLQLIDLMREREMFPRDELQELKHAFSKWSRSGEMHATDVRQVFIFLGWSRHSPAVVSHCDELVKTHKGARLGINQREFLLVARKVREREIELMGEEISKPRGGTSQGRALAVWRRLGYAVEEVEVEDAALEAGLSLDEWMGLDDMWKVLLGFRRREGFCEREVEKMKDYFMRGDTDNSGELSVTEVARTLRTMGYSASCDIAQMLVAQVDADLSGSLDFREFMKLVRIYREMCNSRARSAFMRNAPNAKVRDDVQQVCGASWALQGFADIADAEDLGQAARGMLEAQEGAIGVFGFISAANRWRGHDRELRAARCGFGERETQDLMARFRAMAVDEDGSGLRLQPQALQRLLAEQYPDLASSRDLRPTFRDLLRDAVVTPRGGLHFQGFLRLARGCHDLMEQEQLRREKESVKELGFQKHEVEAFRELFLGGGDRTSLSLEDVQSMLATVVPMGHNNCQEFEKLFGQVASKKPSGKIGVNFPEFLLFIKRCLEGDLGRINEHAEQRARKRKTQDPQHADRASPRSSVFRTESTAHLRRSSIRRSVVGDYPDWSMRSEEST